MIVEANNGVPLCKISLKAMDGEKIFDPHEIKVLKNFVCLVCNIDYGKLQRLYNYIAKLTEANCTNEYKERVFCLFVPYDIDGILSFECSKCSSFRFIKSKEWLDEYVANCPELLLRVKLQPLEQLELASLFIMNKECCFIVPKIV